MGTDVTATTINKNNLTMASKMQVLSCTRGRNRLTTEGKYPRFEKFNKYQ